MKKFILVLLLGFGSLITNANVVEDKISTKTEVTYNAYTCTVTVTIRVVNPENGAVLETFTATSTYTSESSLACGMAQRIAENDAMEQLREAYVY